MKQRVELSRTETLLAVTLSYGTWIATGIIVIGLAMAFAPPANTGDTNARRVVSGGIALLILLPTLRVMLMFGAFIRKRDYRFAAFAGVVLIIIVLGIAIGAHTGIKPAL